MCICAQFLTTMCFLYLGIASLQDIYCEDSITKEQLSCMQDAHAPGYKNNPNFRIASSKTGVILFEDCHYLLAFM